MFSRPPRELAPSGGLSSSSRSPLMSPGFPPSGRRHGLSKHATPYPNRREPRKKLASGDHSWEETIDRWREAQGTERRPTVSLAPMSSFERNPKPLALHRA